MQEQTYSPKPRDSVNLRSPEEQQAIQDWKVQFGRLLDEYRDRYVLHRPPEDKPAP
jgi:hypothetical protein